MKKSSTMLTQRDLKEILIWSNFLELKERESIFTQHKIKKILHSMEKNNRRAVRVVVTESNQDPKSKEKRK